MPAAAHGYRDELIVAKAYYSDSLKVLRQGIRIIATRFLAIETITQYSEGVRHGHRHLGSSRLGDIKFPPW